MGAIKQISLKDMCPPKSKQKSSSKDTCTVFLYKMNCDSYSQVELVVKNLPTHLVGYSPQGLKETDMTEVTQHTCMHTVTVQQTLKHQNSLAILIVYGFTGTKYLKLGMFPKSFECIFTIVNSSD